MIQQIIALVACAIIIAITEPEINRMTRNTPLLFRIGTWLLCTSAISGIFYILIVGNDPSWVAVFGALGVAIYLVADRRSQPRDKWPHLS